MDEKRHNKHKDSKKKRKRRSSSNSSRSESEVWVEKTVVKKSSATSNRDDWLSMGGALKTFTRDDIRPKREEKDKKQNDSYNPATSSRELNPYWKNGGTGVPENIDQFRKTNKFIKPKYEDNYYTKLTSNSSGSKNRRLSSDFEEKQSDTKTSTNTYNKSFNWRKNDPSLVQSQPTKDKEEKMELKAAKEKSVISLYLSDEKMNKLAAKIVKAEIMGDSILVKELKEKLEAAKEFRKQNPDLKNAQNAEKHEPVILIKTTPSGSSRPVVDYKDKINRKGKVKTHNAGGRINYFANDDKYDLARMFQQEKYETNHKNDMQLVEAATKCKDLDNLEDLFEERISQNRRAIQEDKRDERHAKKQALMLEKFQEYCKYCVDSKVMLKHLMISCGKNVYLSLPSNKSLLEGHCIITTIHHHPCVTSVDEDVWEEIITYHKMITQFFNDQNKDVVFFETAIKLNRFPHLAINCVPLPRDVGDMASIYFKKSILECETEWSMNKKIIELKGKNVRKCVPKGLPYFWVDFGMDPGFAHVIENQNEFPETFAQQIIGGMLDLDHRLWKNPQREIGEVQRKKVVNFLKEWKPFEAMYKNDTER